jgi:hypothetical protein
MTFRKHQKMSPPKAKCKQCGVEAAIPGRPDGLGKSCAHYRDTSAQKAAGHKAAVK